MSRTDEILIFHVHEQNSLATAIVDSLHDGGLNARNSSSLNLERSDMLAATRIVVLLWSKEAEKSPSFEAEWMAAFQNWRTILTIPCDDTQPPVQAMSFLHDFNANQDAERAKVELVVAVRKLIKTLPQSPVLVSSGEFYVGSFRDRANAYPNESLLSKPFDLDYDYSIFRLPVLVSEYRLFLETAKGYQISKYWTNAGWRWKDKYNIEAPAGWDKQDSAQQNRYPVTGISFFEAVAYCNWYNEYRSDGNLYRLPTETEWEKAARGGVVFKDGQLNEAPFRIWTWKGAWDNNLANTAESRRRRPISVDDHSEKSYSPYGIVGMSGNLLEWCSNLPENYPSSMFDVSEGGQNRMARGGAYIYPERDARCSRRMEFSPTQRQFMSFRVASVNQSG